MKTTTLTSLALLALVGSLAQAQSSAVSLAVRPDSKLWIEGGSNLHEWSCKASAFDASIVVDPTFAKQTSDVPKFLQRVEIRVPVSNLKCGHGQMDKNLLKALKADAAPTITYILGTFDVDPAKTKDVVSLKTAGTLRVAGQESSVRMNVSATWLADGSVKAVGTLPILMTEFGIKPPTALLGTLKTDNKVIVKFELVVGPETIIAAITPR
jgi:polyisoprenoid-binding protein YceI